MITAFLNQKGGVGKTTLSVSVATALTLRKKRVLLIDADPQHGALNWQSHREGAPLFPIVGLPTDKLHREVNSHTPNYDHIIIDSPPRLESIARSIILASDLILIPVQPSPHDIWSAAAVDVFTALENYPFPTLTTAVRQRVAFAESAAAGQSVLETDPGSPAVREIESITDEILEMMNQ